MRLERVLALDESASRKLRALARPGVSTWLLSSIAHSGDSIVVLPILAFAWWRTGLGRSGAASAAIAGAVSAMALVVIVKALFRRPRPAGNWGSIYRRADPHSFPSGHAARTLAIAAAAFIAMGPVAGLALTVWSAAVGISRVSLGVHWLSDALVGWLAGACAGIAAALILA